MIQYYELGSDGRTIEEMTFAEKPCGYSFIDNLLQNGEKYPRSEWLEEIGSNGNGTLYNEAVEFFTGCADAVLYNSEDDTFYVEGFIFRDHPQCDFSA